jgi:hypothetical protein
MLPVLVAESQANDEELERLALFQGASLIAAEPGTRRLQIKSVLIENPAVSDGTWMLRSKTRTICPRPSVLCS